MPSPQKKSPTGRIELHHLAQQRRANATIAPRGLDCRAAHDLKSRRCHIQSAPRFTSGVHSPWLECKRHLSLYLSVVLQELCPGSYSALRGLITTAHGVRGFSHHAREGNQSTWCNGSIRALVARDGEVQFFPWAIFYFLMCTLGVRGLQVAPDAITDGSEAQPRHGGVANVSSTP